VFRDQRVIVVMPAYNSAATLRRTHAEVLAQEGIVDEVIVVDDAGSDDTVAIAATLPRTIAVRHERNLGYGGNQKTCYRLALDRGADIVIMVHPDFQYTPMLIPAMASLIANGVYECVLGSRILGGRALAGGMPIWKFVANRGLTWAENLLLNATLSEYHTGYRAFSRALLERVPFENNANGFVFDNQILAQIHWLGYTIAEVTCPTKYFKEASSIDFSSSCRYGLGCLATGLHYRLARWGLVDDAFYRPKPAGARRPALTAALAAAVADPDPGMPFS